MDQSQQTNSTRESLRKIRLETRQTRSLEILREHFEQLQDLRRQSMDDFDLQVMIGDIHQEIVDRARYLRGDAPAPAPATAREDHSVIFQAKPSERKSLQESSAAPALPSAAVSPFDSPAPRPVMPPATPVLPPAASVVRAAASPPPVAKPRAAAAPEGPTDAAEIPPEIMRVDAMSWKKIVWLAMFLCAIALAAFFYLIQTARKLNMPEENSAQTEQSAKPLAAAAPVVAAVSTSPTLRLYTDLSAGTVTFDTEAPRSLVDGELMLNNLPAGQHSIRVTGSSGSASFDFDVAAKNAPKVTGIPQASNALLVLVSEQDGRGQLITSAGPSQILVDGKAAGQTSPTGLELVGLGNTDHDLQVVHDLDRQRFVMTYTPAPVLTVYVKSDPNTGILQIVTGEDNVEVYIENTLFRRRTERGQLRMSLRAGRYPVRVHKDGFADPPAQWVDLKKADVTQAKFEFAPISNVATLQIHGAQAGTTAYIDHEFAGAVGPDGNAKIANVKSGEHTVELRHDLAITKRLQRVFHGGETLTLAGSDVALEKSVPDTNKPAPPVVVVPVGSEEGTKAPSPASTENQPEAPRFQIGGGFVPYGTPKAPGHYSFRTQGHVGGILKKSKLQWYAGYKDSQNYVLFSLDGKHAEVREMRNGKYILWNRVACSVDSASWVQVDMAVKPGTVSSRVKIGDEWVELGSVSSFGRDFTQDRVGFYIPANDQVAVANFKFANR